MNGRNTSGIKATEKGYTLYVINLLHLRMSHINADASSWVTHKDT